MTSTSAESPGKLVTVTVIGAPVRVWADASQRHQELLREFALLQFGHASGQDVPARLLALSEELTGRYAGLMATNNARRDEAVAAGKDRLDLAYDVPAAILDPCRQMLHMLAEVDDFCAADKMLTLATPPVQKAFRVWFPRSVHRPDRWSGPHAMDGAVGLRRDRGRRALTTARRHGAAVRDAETGQRTTPWSANTS